jgi:FixJ family two-component response regulator
MADTNDVRVIAIVDDDPSVRQALLRVVESAGYKGVAFASGREFLAWLPDGDPACVVLDVHMEEMTGFQVHGRLAVPVIFITARDDPATRDGIAESRSRHLQKPFTTARLLEAIRHALDSS